jgi:uncharacterized protein with PIN domain
MGADKRPVVMCPGCNIEMRVVQVEPTKLDDRMDEVTYRCPQCGAETKRQYSR